MPDGSPNMGMISMLQQIKGQEKESAQNGKAALGIKSLLVLPSGQTALGQSFGVPL